jgi:hypothetical protein
VANWSPTAGFDFGFNDYTTFNCEGTEICQVYPADQPLQGKVDQDAGTIELSVPRSYLFGLNGPTGPGQRPTLDKAKVGTRFYDATAFSLGNTSPDPSTQSFLYPYDNPPAMDFRLPGATTQTCTNLIRGTAAAETLVGTAGSDRIRGRDGADEIHGREGDDCLFGQGDPDVISGEAGNDHLKGGRKRDQLMGGTGDDVVRAPGGGRDTLDCGPGDDIAYAKVGFDTVSPDCETVRGR